MDRQWHHVGVVFQPRESACDPCPINWLPKDTGATCLPPRSARGCKETDFAGFDEELKHIYVRDKCPSAKWAKCVPNQVCDSLLAQCGGLRSIVRSRFMLMGCWPPMSSPNNRLPTQKGAGCTLAEGGCFLLHCCHCLSASLHDCLSAFLHYCLSASLHCCLPVLLPILPALLSPCTTALLPPGTTVSLPPCMTVSLPPCTTVSLPPCTAVSLHYCLSASLYYCLPASLCYCHSSLHCCLPLLLPIQPLSLPSDTTTGCTSDWLCAAPTTLCGLRRQNWTTFGCTVKR